jgi:antitoxin component of MazEF toxin-antitoxin module
MSNYIATVINTGNSIALRVPKQYAVEARLVPGEKVQLNLPRRYMVQDRAKINRVIAELQAMNAGRQ